MRYRQLSPSGDYTFGSGQQNFLINSPATVAQAVETSLKLWLGEWYLDLSVGTPYPEGVVGKHSQEKADLTIISQINQVAGVVSVQDFQSNIDPNTRKYTVTSCIINTVFGQTQLQMQNATNF